MLVGMEQEPHVRGQGYLAFGKLPKIVADAIANLSPATGLTATSTPIIIYLS
jgi:hypothetical protein